MAKEPVVETCDCVFCKNGEAVNDGDSTVSVQTSVGGLKCVERSVRYFKCKFCRGRFFKFL